MAVSSTSFKFGNNAWMARSSAGRNPIFTSPEHLEGLCYEYFEWVQKNPLIAAETVKHQGQGKTMAVPRMRAMTVVGLCNFLDIDPTTWYDYAKKADFSHICKKVERIIYQQKLEGAAADMLNSSIIVRELGLADKSEVKEKKSMEVVIRDYDPAIDGDPHEHFTDSEDKPKGID